MPNYTPAPSYGGMTINPDAQTTNWSIAAGITAGFSVPVGITGVLFSLTNADTGYSWPYVFAGVTIAGGVPIAVDISAPGSTSFTTSPAIGPDDFGSFGSLKGLDFVPGIGGSAAWINIWSVNHSPNPIYVGGLQIGVSGGIGWTGGRFMLIKSLGGTYDQVAALDPDDLSSAISELYYSAQVPSWITA